MIRTNIVLLMAFHDDSRRFTTIVLLMAFTTITTIHDDCFTDGFSRRFTTIHDDRFTDGFHDDSRRFTTIVLLMAFTRNRWILEPREEPHLQRLLVFDAVDAYLPGAGGYPILHLKMMHFLLFKMVHFVF